ncbi:Transposase IS200 like protein [Paraliobacillus sp. PM-2]|uniref:transposase n=1 Tax=Paraliobacillus sp. PM-2 TaxID=1462524 RepID=UPI00061BDE83|nr:transposase [Paraliobacillus sp. PM-2]CQR46247.1 Transposase IS200 like protein [Paraliobacillus sp. PM-2]
MPRKKRIWFPGAKYHITSRGIRRTSLFHDDNDRIEYLRLLEETKFIYPFILHAYCLMTNHIHLQLETIDQPTGTIMKYLHSAYATYFNRKYHYSGHVFESRYGAELIDSVAYELEVNKYIHLNPLRANMVQDLNDYKWSSFLNYRYADQSSLVTTDRIFTFFRAPKVDSYLHYLHANVKEADRYTVIKQEIIKRGE